MAGDRLLAIRHKMLSAGMEQQKQEFYEETRFFAAQSVKDINKRRLLLWSVKIRWNSGGKFT